MISFIFKDKIKKITQTLIWLEKSEKNQKIYFAKKIYVLGDGILLCIETFNYIMNRILHLMIEDWRENLSPYPILQIHLHTIFILLSLTNHEFVRLSLANRSLIKEGINLILFLYWFWSGARCLKMYWPFSFLFFPLIKKEREKRKKHYILGHFEEY